MVLERARQRQEEQQAAQLEEQKRQEQEDRERQIELSDRYREEHPKVAAEQQILFAELAEIGLIAELEEITGSKSFHIQLTDEERDLARERMRAKMKELPSEMSPEVARRGWDRVWEAKWQGGILFPKQEEDGSLNSTICIWVDDQVYVNSVSDSYRTRKLIEITYTPDRTLTFKGQEEITFQDAFDSGKPDEGTLKEALVEVFANPQLVKPLPLL